MRISFILILLRTVMNRPFDLAWRVLKNKGSPTGLPENFHHDNIIDYEDFENLDYFHYAVTSLSDLPSDYNRVYDSRTGQEMDLKYPIGAYGEDFFIHRNPETLRNEYIRMGDMPRRPQ